MVDKKPNIFEEKVRLPQELMDALRRIKGQAQLRGKKPPAFGDLLLEAWRCYMESIASSGHQPPAFESDLERNVSRTESADIHTPEIAGIIRPDDEPWVHKLLQIRHSQKPGLITALEYNLNEFTWAAAAYDELVKHQSPLVSRPVAGTGRRRTPPRELSRDAGDREPAIESGSAHGDVDEAIERITKAQRERHQGKKGHPRKAG